MKRFPPPGLPQQLRGYWCQRCPEPQQLAHWCPAGIRQGANGRTEGRRSALRTVPPRTVAAIAACERSGHVGRSEWAVAMPDDIEARTRAILASERVKLVEECETDILRIGRPSQYALRSLLEVQGVLNGMRRPEPPGGWPPAFT